MEPEGGWQSPTGALGSSKGACSKLTHVPRGSAHTYSTFSLGEDTNYLQNWVRKEDLMCHQLHLPLTRPRKSSGGQRWDGDVRPSDVEQEIGT